MSKVIINGINENGIMDADVIRTPVLVTELIHDFPNLCEAEIANRLKEIRDSAELDQTVMHTYLSVLKAKSEDDQVDEEDEWDDEDWDDFERQMVLKGMDALDKCIKEYHDMGLALTILELCKCIGGDKFHAEITLD